MIGVYVGDFNFLHLALILHTETPFSRLSMTSVISSSDQYSLPSVENMAYFPMNPYSVDLRERIVDSVAVGRSRADVNPPFPNLAGDAHRRSHRVCERGRQLHIASNQYPALQLLIADAPDSTLADLSTQWQARIGVRVIQAT
jgi:hypothetical protein